MRNHIPAVFQRTLDESLAWLDELVAALPGFTRDDAYHLLRAVLHPLRDQLTTAEAVDLGAQMPMLLRGMYLEGWRPGRQARPLTSREGFTFQVWQHVGRRLEMTDHPMESALFAVRQLLAHRISAGELRHVAHVLPKGIRELFPAAP
jgi:uncharacterized protein (DUF2267 family)